MILSIHQPSYFPWLGLLHKISQSDVFVLLDEVQLSDSAYQHRNLFLTSGGDARYLSIPFVRKGYLGRAFREIEIASPDWAVRHQNFLWANYRKHPFAAEIMPPLEAYFAACYASLLEAVQASLMLCLTLFRIPARVLLQSSLPYDRALRKGDLVLDLARAAGADCYLSGTGAQAYLDERAFGDGMALRYDQFTHPVYPQKNTQAFMPGLSCLDLLFNTGIEGGRTYLRTEPDS